MLTVEDKQEISKLVVDAMDGERDRRRAKFSEEAKSNPAKINTKLYLITMGGRIAFPDERGRSILHETFYARVPIKENEGPLSGSFYGGRIEVVAFGDGKMLDRSVGVLISGSPIMVEVDDGFLETTS